jgi:hypothetical protein
VTGRARTYGRIVETCIAESARRQDALAGNLTASVMNTLKVSRSLPPSNVLAIFAAWVGIWQDTWRAAVEPTVARIYRARIRPSDCLAPIAWWWKRQAGCRLI